MTTTTLGPQDDLGIDDNFGEGGVGLTPDGSSSPQGASLRDILRSHSGAVWPGGYADTAALTASLDKYRQDRQLAVLADGSIWTWKAADTTAADATHIAPTDVGVGAGRWVAVATTPYVPGTGAGEIRRVGTAFNLAAIQALTSGTAFNVGAVLPANARLFGVEVVVGTPVTGGTLSACTLKVGDATTDDSAMASQDVFTGAGTFSDPGTNPIMSRGGVQMKGKLTATGDTLAHATAGSITINVYYAVAA